MASPLGDPGGGNPDPQLTFPMITLHGNKKQATWMMQNEGDLKCHSNKSVEKYEWTEKRGNIRILYRVSLDVVSPEWLRIVLAVPESEYVMEDKATDRLKCFKVLDTWRRREDINGSAGKLYLKLIEADETAAAGALFDCIRLDDLLMGLGEEERNAVLDMEDYCGKVINNNFNNNNGIDKDLLFDSDCYEVSEVVSDEGVEYFDVSGQGRGESVCGVANDVLMNRENIQIESLDEKLIKNNSVAKRLFPVIHFALLVFKEFWYPRLT